MPKEALELLKVHGGGAEDGVDRVTGGAFEPIALEPMLALEVADGGFDCGAAFHPTPERLRGRAPAALVDMHRLRAAVIVAAIAHVDMRFRRSRASLANEPTHLRELLIEGVPVVRIARLAQRAEQPPAPAGRRDTRLVTKLVFFPGLALGDAADLGFMHAVDFVFVGGLLRVDALRGG